MKQKISIGLLILIDLLIVNLSIIFAYLIKFDFIIPRTYFKAIPILLASASFIKITIFLASRLYKSLWKYAGTKEFIFIGFYILVGNIALIGYGIFYNISVPISIYLIISFLDVVMISSTRIFYRVIRRTLSGHSINSKNLKKVLIYGAGDLGAIVLNELTKKSNSLYKAVVVIDDDRSKQGKKIKGIPIVSGNENLMSVIVKYEIEEVLMAISNVDNTVLSKVYNVCKMQDCKVKIMPAISQLINGNFSINRIREVKIEDLLGRAQINLDNDKVVKFLKNKTVLVTGAGGSIGSELCRQIAIYEPSKLIILDNYENNAFNLYNELLRIHPKLDVKVVIANIRESLRLKRIFKEYNPCVVFHAAAHKHVPLMEANPTEAVKNNVLGTKNVAEAAALAGVEKFVLISTDKAVNPTNIMGATKRLAEMIIQGINKKTATEFVAVRFGNVLGSNGSVIPTFKNQIKDGGPVTVTHKEVTRFFMTIPEAAQLVLQAGGMAKGGEIFVLDMGKPVKIYDLAKKVIELSGFKPEVDIKIKITGLRPGEKLYEELLLKEDELTKTENNKIFIEQPSIVNYQDLKEKLLKLENLLNSETKEVIEFIKYMVPTYNEDTKDKDENIVYIEKKELGKPVYAN